MWYAQQTAVAIDGSFREVYTEQYMKTALAFCMLLPYLTVEERKKIIFICKLFCLLCIV